MKYLITILFIIIFILKPDANIYGFHNESSIWSHFSYIFMHDNVLHLSVNILSFLSASIFMKQFFKKTFFFYTSFLIAIAVSFIPICIYNTPTVGASAVVYAMLGFITPKLNIIKYHLFYISLSISFIIPSFFNNVNTYLHISAFATALLLSFFITNLKKLKFINQ